MTRFVGTALLVAGVGLIIFGINASESFSSDVSRFLTGSPTNKSIWLLASGIVAAIMSLLITMRKARND